MIKVRLAEGERCYVVKTDTPSIALRVVQDKYKREGRTIPDEESVSEAVTYIDIDGNDINNMYGGMDH